MSKNNLAVPVKQAQHQSLNEPGRVCSSIRVRSHSLNPDTSSLNKLNNTQICREIRSLNTRLADVLSKNAQRQTECPIENPKEDLIKMYESELCSKTHLIEELIKENSELKSINVSLQDKLSNSENEIRRLNETGKRVLELEQVNDLMRKEMSFKDNVHKKEVAEYKKQIEIEEKTIESRIRVNLLDDFRLQLDEALSKKNDEMNQLIAEIESHHKIQNSEYKARIDNMTRQIQDLQLELKKITESYHAEKYEHDLLKTKYDKEMKRMDTVIQERTENNQELLKSIEILTNELKELKDTKVSVENEIRQYRNLLLSEERRMNITPESNASIGITSSPIDNENGNQDLVSPVRMTSSLIDGLVVSTKKRRRISYDSDEQLEIVQRNPDVSMKFKYDNGKVIIEDSNSNQNNNQYASFLLIF